MLYIAPDVQTAAILVGFFYTFIVAFSGVVQHIKLMPSFWTFMNKVSPYTYFINLSSSILQGRKVTCSPHELSHFNPPSSQTCIEFAGNFINSTGGYLVDPNATTNCGYCQYSSTERYMSNIGVKFSYRWRNLGFFCVYIVFDIAAMLFLYWLFRYRTGSLLPKFLKKKSN